jgi:hypothetical protein
LLQPHLEAARNAPRLNHEECKFKSLAAQDAPECLSQPLTQRPVATHAETLLQTIHAHYESSLEEYMKTKTRNHHSVHDSPWGELRHALGRLLSYFIAIKVLISARKFWPRLFVDFTVTTIPSTPPLSSPPVIRRNARGIIQRMSRSKSTLDAYQRHQDHLQTHGGLDERIRHRVSPARFRPIVHAEVNLLASVLRDQALAEADGEDPVRFFNQAEFGAYIGSSKPTCRLCSLYFAAHPSGVKCRESHGNLYPNWRVPDVPPSGLGLGEDGGGEEAERRLQTEILEAMVREVRKDADRAIREKSYSRRKHDSWDTPSNPLRSTTVGGSRGVGSVDGASMRGVSDESREATPESGGWEDGIGLAERMGQVSLDASPIRGGRTQLQETTPKAVRVAGSDDEEEDEDGGGAIL